MEKIFDFVKDLYSIHDQILGFEYCGARSVLCDIEVGKSFWKEAIILRRATGGVVNPKKPFLCELFTKFNLVEFDNEHDLCNYNVTDYYLQSLLVFLRIFSPNCPVVADAFTTVIMSEKLDGQHELRFTLISQLFSYNKGDDNPSNSAASKAMTCAICLSEKLINANRLNSIAKNMTAFKLLVNFISSNVCPFKRTTFL